MNHDVTGLLLAWRGGDTGAPDRLFELLYDDLHAVAHRQLAYERPGHTLNTTGLVHEAYLRLVDQERAALHDRANFLGVAARVMRRVLIDHARRQKARKRGGERIALSLTSADDAGEVRVADARAEAFVALDEALEQLSAVDERLGRVVECRFFGGLTDAETATVLGVGERTVRRDWLKAKAWLSDVLRE
jgi:RNA polymerase sigma factor (TIGR02999 family)